MPQLDHGANALVGVMAAFGRFELQQELSGLTAVQAWNLLSPFLPLSQTDPMAFTELLCHGVTPAGGFAAYGASRALAELVGLSFDTPAAQAVLDGGIAFLREAGVPPMRVRPYEWDRWLDTGGNVESWLPVRPPPPPERPGITPLRPAETRLVAKLGAEQDSNRVFISRDGTDFVAIVDARYSDEDPTRARWVWHRASTLYLLYLQVGRSLQTPPHWVAAELEAYVPLPAPRF
ncbi:hypothetical protein [Micromonospora wenchangensis]|uniref:hypothetical protein n=1 Tax=Micromonospora wenchangensis TaxID=1185415 RepID=UPI003D759285